MATLTETAKSFRLLTKVLWITLVVFICLRISYKIIKMLFPPAPPGPPSPQNAFGPLPSPLFEAVEGLSLLENQNLTYKLDLIGTSNLPEVLPLSSVFVVQKPVYSLLAPQRAQELA